MLTTKVNKEKRRKKIAREKEEKIKRRRNQEIEKERRKRTKKQRRQKIKNLEKRVINSSPGKLSEVSGEIRNDSDLLEEYRQNLEEKYYRKRIVGCLHEELPEIREEIKNDPLLDKRKKEKLWITILNLPFSQRKALPPNVIEQVKKDLLEELGEEEFRKNMKWLIQDTELENTKIIKEGVKSP